MTDQKKTCGICFDDDINDFQMFSVPGCGHRFCSQCVKRYIEVRLLERSLVRCPHTGCKSNLSLEICDYLLTPKLRAMWKRKKREDSIPLTQRIYCPNRSCSALMSETELYKPSEAGGKRICVKCGRPFCISCKVSWHSYLSCSFYKRLHPNPTYTANGGKLKALARKEGWRQCRKCKHMIELSQGCARITCRCGHTFCYKCGADAEGCSHGHLQMPPLPDLPPPRPRISWPRPPRKLLLFLLGRL
ncbi:unnamed protein product [Microthlaspi erraticum]|uniref:RBR-type E3 ubiquitin transferase n=1 Tax=Microthlaspi erraticum TaxID=1685480 RepID=A0A6D2JEK2_9BRAS|nr:unnamed protein product [Microthlaspi erraticum]